MWDLQALNHCRSATQRMQELAPAVNRVAEKLRERGALIIHAPSDCMAAYANTEARLRAVNSPHADAHVAFDWNWPDTSREPLVSELIWPWDPSVASRGECSCDPPEDCSSDGPRLPWTRQLEAIEIQAADAVTDSGQEAFNLLEERRIEDVLLMGVHTNVCVLSRDFGIRQLRYLGKKPVLCRDLTDSFHRHPDGHFVGNRLVLDHVERFWCPTVTSDQLVGGEPFRFASDAAG